jgi:hypothetical protein
LRASDSSRRPAARVVGILDLQPGRRHAGPVLDGDELRGARPLRRRGDPLRDLRPRQLAQHVSNATRTAASVTRPFFRQPYTACVYEGAIGAVGVMVNAVAHIRHLQSTMAGIFARISMSFDRQSGQLMTSHEEILGRTTAACHGNRGSPGSRFSNSTPPPRNPCLPPRSGAVQPRGTCVVIRSRLKSRSAMPWQCPACRTPIRYSEIDGRPRQGKVYRCHICRLELVLDTKRDRFTLAPLETDEPPPRTRRHDS